MHNIETLFSVRQVPWHGLGRIIQDAPDSKAALELAGLDWTVDKQEVCLKNGQVIPNQFANVRSSDGSVLGIVTDRYKIVQNAEAFAFTDDLIGGNVRYETAGSLLGGRKVWMLARLPERTVVGDEVIPYLCFTNSHDGSGSVRAMMTPVRVVCNNTLNLAISTAKRAWKASHATNIQKRLKDARESLELADHYMYELDNYADKLANITINEDAIIRAYNAVNPLAKDAPVITKIRHDNDLTSLLECNDAADIKKFKGTAWGAANAIADFVDHRPPSRQTDKWKETRWDDIMNGSVVVDKFMIELMLQVAKAGKVTA